MAFRIKHLPTGYYYQPHKHGGSNLSVRGKIYHTESTAKSSLKVNGGAPTIQVAEGSRIHKLTEDLLAYEPVRWAYRQVKASTQNTDWVIEKMES
jgi:hypothetical protein